MTGQVGQGGVQGVALAHQAAAVALQHIHARVHPGPLGGAVGAVIGDHINIQQAGGVILGFQAFQQLIDHRFLVAGGDQHGVPARGAFGLQNFFFFEQAHQQVKSLVRIGGKK